MKKFYIIFFVGFIILSGLLYVSTWWFLGGVAIIVLFTTYHFYNARLRSFSATIEELESSMEELQKQLDRSLIKEESARKEAQQIRQTKKHLLTTISHEIRTPMNGVLGMSLLLGDTALTNEQKIYIDTIKSSGKGLLDTVNNILTDDILEYSKLDRKDKRLQNIDFNLLDTVEEVINMFGSKASEKGLELLSDIDDNVSLQLSGDNRRLREILMNLIENAVKFTQQGQVIVRVQALNGNSSKPVLSFEVEDSGTGIDKEQIEELFYSVPARGFDNGEKKCGRGLVMCRKNAELMGGKIDVKSNPGSGSIFTFIVQFEHNTGNSMHTNGGSEHIRTLGGKHVLVVDDNSAVRNIMIKKLKAWNLITTAAGSGPHAFEILAQNNKFDIVLIDLSMPQVDGLQCARMIKKTFPQLSLVLMNQPGSESYKLEQELFAAILVKPVRQHDLMNNLLALVANDADKKNNLKETQKDFSKNNPLEILIAEDNLVNQKIAIKILTKLGYQPGVANNGREAVEMSGQCDMILMDVQMPEMDGLEATKMIRNKQGDQPVIMAMTANVLQGDRDACLQGGMDDYISKPIDPDELLRQLEKWSLIIRERKKVKP